MSLRKLKNPILWFEIDIWSFSFFFLYLFYLHCFSSALLTFDFLRERTNSNKVSNINEIMIMKSWYNQDIAPYKIFRKLVNLEFCRGHNFNLQHARCFFVHHFIFVKFKQFSGDPHLKNHQLPKINEFCMCISYIGLDLIFSNSPSFKFMT